jgi:hypothetical protein
MFNTNPIPIHWIIVESYMARWLKNFAQRQSLPDFTQKVPAAFAARRLFQIRGAGVVRIVSSPHPA